MIDFVEIEQFIRHIYSGKPVISLHEPSFNKTDFISLERVLASTYVSSIGPEIKQFEESAKTLLAAEGAVATVNGTAALHTLLHYYGIGAGSSVITQSLSFVATGNAILMSGAKPIFCDVSSERLSLSADAVKSFLERHTTLNSKGKRVAPDGTVVRAVMVVHTLGHLADLAALKEVCEEFDLLLLEDSAESLGSELSGKKLGCYADGAALSFNGNKILTTGGGGMVVLKSKDAEEDVRHLVSTSKKHHKYEFVHDGFGFNYRMPNINAALGLSQLKRLDLILNEKRKLALMYKEYFTESESEFVDSPDGTQSNFWLNSIKLHSKVERDGLLNHLVDRSIFARPFWVPLHRTAHFKDCWADKMVRTNDLYERVVCLPSSVAVGD